MSALPSGRRWAAFAFAAVALFSAQPAHATEPAPARHTADSTADRILSSVRADLLAASDQHFHLGEFNHVINVIRLLVQLDPHDVDLYDTAAWLLWSTTRGEAAIEFLKQGLAANPRVYDLYDALGTHYWIRLHDAKTAAGYFQSAVRFPRVPFTTWHSLAHALEALGDWPAAVRAWEAAAAYPGNDTARRLLARARAHVAAPPASAP